MNDMSGIDEYGVLSERDTLTIRRVLPGPIERVWAYLTDSELRRKWLAAGTMQMKAGSDFELTWRNDELSSVPSARPAGMPEEHSMKSQIVECDPPRRLVITWRNSGNVSFELAPKGSDVLLTLIHRRLPDRNTLLMVAAGWHMHLDTMVARANSREIGKFWDGWLRLKADYDKRIPA